MKEADTVGRAEASGGHARRPLRVAAVQLNSRADVEDNLAGCAALVQRAADHGAELVVLPENFAYAGTEGARRRLAEVVGGRAGPIQSAVAELAVRHGVTIVAGGMPERSSDPDRPYNTCLVFSPGGSVLASYRKLHLFDVELLGGATYRESASTSAGDVPVVVEIGGTPVGLSICYDLRFPELYRTLAALGAEVVLVPSAFTLTTGSDHWHVLLRARAIENQCWVVAPNQWGRHAAERECYGHSLIADPWGTIVAECSDGPGLACAELDPVVTHRVRDSLPALRHRRPALATPR